METRKQGRRQLNGDKYIVARVSLRRRKRLRIADHWMGSVRAFLHEAGCAVEQRFEWESRSPRRELGTEYRCLRSKGYRS